MKKRALLLRSDNWMGLFVDAQLVTEGHKISLPEFLELAETYKFSSSELVDSYMEEDDEKEANECGGYPQNQSDLKHDYFA